MKLQQTINKKLSIGLFLAMLVLTLPIIAAAQGRIAFDSDRDGNDEIYVMNADGSNQTRLTDNSASDSSPSCSTDGSKIVFVSTRDGNAEIYVMNSDGSNPTRLTDSSGLDFDPSFSPTEVKSFSLPIVTVTVRFT
jgi:tricorn protease-like protein